MNKFALMHLVAAATLPTSAVYAQDNVDNYALGDIVVTARKVSEPLQKTPISVTALDAETLQRRGLADLRDISTVSPSVNVAGNNQFGEFPISIRGIASSSSGIGADDPVAVYLDGVYLGRPAATFFEFGDTERIEVLRGPQGTLYGRNATAGAVNIITRQPTDHLEGEIYAGYGMFNTVRLNSWISGPVSEQVSGKISGFYSKTDGFETNLVNGRRINATENYGIRVAAKLVPTDNFTLTVSADYTSQQDPAAFHAAATPAFPFDWDHVYINEAVKSNRKLGGVAATAELNLGGFTLKSVTGYRALKLDYLSDSDATPNQVFETRADPLKQNQFSQELQLTSDPTKSFSYILGLYYFHERSTLSINTFSGGVAAIRLRDSNNTDSFAAYIQGRLALTEQLSFDAGVRYTSDKKKFFIVNNDGRGGAFVIAPTYLDKSWDAVTPHFSANFQATDTILLYASATRGYKSGGFNFAALQPAFNPEKLWSFEAGVKSDFLDRRARVNLSVFRYDYKDLQVRQNPSPGVIQTLNAASARITGIELEGALRPFDNFRLDFGVTYLDPQYKDFRFGATVFSGNQMARSSKWQGFVSAVANADIGDGNLEGTLTYRGQSRLYFTEANSLLLAQAPHYHIDARVAYTFGQDGNITFALTGKNLADKRYITNGLQVGAFRDVTVNQPRTIAGEVRYRF